MLATIALTRRPVHACLLDLVREQQPAARRAVLRELDGRALLADFGRHDGEIASKPAATARPARSRTAHTANGSPP